MNQIDILKNVLKNEGLRYTQQRQIIWDEIRNSTEHRDAEEIYLIIKKNGFCCYKRLNHKNITMKREFNEKSDSTISYVTPKKTSPI